MANDKSIPGYHVLSEAWYGEATLKIAEYEDEITIGRFYEGGGCDYEFAVRWMCLDGRKPDPQLQLFSDAWQAFADPPMIELFKAFSAMINPTVELVTATLNQLGFTDMTARKKGQC